MTPEKYAALMDRIARAAEKRRLTQLPLAINPVPRTRVRQGRAPKPRKTYDRATPSPRVTRECLKCGAPFSPKPSAVRAGEGKYCSRACSVKFGAENPVWKGGVSSDNMRYRRRFLEKSPEKVRAQQIAQRAIQNGWLVREPCEQCGSEERIHAHHDDHSRPLDIRWLCQSCHNRHHGRMRVLEREARRK